MADDIKINSSSCISCGTCASLFPDIFEIGEDSVCHVKKGAKFSSAEEAKTAVSSCPTEAISVTEKEAEKKP